MRAAAVILLSLCACNTTTKSPAQDLAGTWKIASATNPGGAGSYRGAVHIARRGDAYLFDWKIARTPSYRGVGLARGNLLGVGWTNQGGSPTVVVYEVNGGTLAGRTAALSTAGTGAETLQGPPGPAGTYHITAAHAPGGGAYTGSVVITPTGPTYRVHWELSTGNYEGVGILDGSTFVAGRGKDGAGVILYRKDGAALDGKWAQPTSAALGTERLER